MVPFCRQVLGLKPGSQKRLKAQNSELILFLKTGLGWPILVSKSGFKKYAIMSKNKVFWPIALNVRRPFSVQQLKSREASCR
jgi:hypothetical protein